MARARGDTRGGRLLIFFVVLFVGACGTISLDYGAAFHPELQQRPLCGLTIIGDLRPAGDNRSCIESTLVSNPTT